MNRCVGCGSILQNIDEHLDGYVSDLSHELCFRCFSIKNYGKNISVNKTNVDYMSIFDRIKDDDTVLYVSSLLTLNLDYIDRFKKVILVLTKRDVIPKSVNDNKIINYVIQEHKNVKDVIIVSSYKKYNIDKLYNTLMKYKDTVIYMVGMTNSGKSTLVNQLIESYTDKIGNITMSNFPSTTLDVVPTVVGELTINDTPGIINENSVINYVDDKMIKRINSRKEIKPLTFQVKGHGAISIDDYLFLVYNTISSSMTFYVSNNLIVRNCSLKNNQFTESIVFESSNVSNSDLVIEDIGFVKITNDVSLKIHCVNDVYLYLRRKLI